MRNVSERHSAAPSKLKFMIFAMALSFIMVSYQNCGKPNSGTSYSLKNISGSARVSYQFNLNIANQLGLIKNSNDGYGPYIYNVNLTTGVVEKRYYEVDANDPANVVLGTFCLDNDTKQHLQDVVNASTICLYEQTVPEGAICTQEYAYPHTVIQPEGNVYKLGEKTNGCPPKIYDICDNQTDIYKVTIAALLNEVEAMACH